MILRNAFFVAILVFLLVGCYDNLENSTDRDVIAQPEIKVDTELFGHVVDENGLTISNYTIKVGDNEQFVDGTLFHLNPESVNKFGQAVEIIKKSKLAAFSYVNLLENDVNAIQLSLFNPLNHTFSDPEVDNIFEINDQTSFQLPVGSLVEASDIRYGVVNSKNSFTSVYKRTNQLLNHYNPPFSSFSMTHLSCPESGLTILCK